MQKLFRNLILVLAAASVAPAFASAKEDDDEHWRWHSNTEFAWQVQMDAPALDLGRELDSRIGLGLGMQWNHFQSNGFASRTRLEWNVFPEGNPVGAAGLKTKASNYVLSFDRLYHFKGESKGLYVLGGRGAVRWFMDQTPAGAPTQSTHTTKLAVTGGLGYRFGKAFALEARYLVSSVNHTYDGNVMQASAGMRF